MTFLAPGWFALLAVVAAIAVAYVVLQQRRRHYAIRFTNLELLESVAPRRPGWRRHVAAGGMALALVALIFGIARPARIERIPKSTATIMLVLDTSGSMMADDVAPSRIEAATSAARKFINALPPRLTVGLVTFDRSTRLLSPPTADHALVARSLDGLQTSGGTATGDAIYTALDAISASGGAGVTNGKQTAAIVLLSDGATTIGRPVDEAAQAAAEQKVPITTIAFGTANGVAVVQGRDIPVPADPATMKAVADASGGAFFEAFSAKELQKVYRAIGNRVGYDIKRHEISMTFVGVALALALLALAASLVWTGRLL
jgi:Ca-activated chloride channel family protein